ncbi:hypothetical protein GCM10022419_062540 [Nonomuraea rosea]|uniref:Subtilisin inhibitor domain-containing protein n=1 Tax=Nonomuraea rosea TaxID=638574 RepID=A0ABP6XV96_9ACTN
MRAKFAVLGTLAAAIVTAGAGISAAHAETGPQAVPLVRYFDGLQHYVTSGARPGPKYREEGRVPILTSNLPGTRAIYGCLAGNARRDQFLTGESDCENSVSSSKNNTFLRREGFLYKSPGAGRRALYRCYVPHTQSHFVSVRSDCESNPPASKVNAEFILGYFPSAQAD